MVASSYSLHLFVVSAVAAEVCIPAARHVPRPRGVPQLDSTRTARACSNSPTIQGLSSRAREAEAQVQTPRNSSYDWTASCQFGTHIEVSRK
eukprot:scaffold478_cov409-Prasinococcus_capsulatus_cf.AAC.10